MNAETEMLKFSANSRKMLNLKDSKEKINFDRDINHPTV